MRKQKQNLITNTLPIPANLIERRIYLIRGRQVMLDSDLAELYQVKAIALRQQVKRNRSRFPNDFLFQLNAAEADFLASQNVIPSKQSLGGYLPYVFTEHGIAMLAAVLKSPRAVQMSIFIVRAFIQLRKIPAKNRELFQRLKKVEVVQKLHGQVLAGIISEIIRTYALAVRLRRTASA